MWGQDIKENIVKLQVEKPRIAVIDFRGAGDAQKFMATFNTTLWDELSNSGVLQMVGKSFYPLDVPQQPQDFKAPTLAPARRGEQPRTQKNGPWLTDWSGPPDQHDISGFWIYSGTRRALIVARISV